MVLLMVLELKVLDFPSSSRVGLAHVACRFGTLTLPQSSDSSIIWRSISGLLVANRARLISHQWWAVDRGRSMGKPRFGDSARTKVKWVVRKLAPPTCLGKLLKYD